MVLIIAKDYHVAPTASVSTGGVQSSAATLPLKKSQPPRLPSCQRLLRLSAAAATVAPGQLLHKITGKLPVLQRLSFVVARAQPKARSTRVLMDPLTPAAPPLQNGYCLPFLSRIAQADCCNHYRSSILHVAVLADVASSLCPFGIVFWAVSTCVQLLIIPVSCSCIP